MFRKHTRRAAKAAFAISFGVALLIGLTACGGRRRQQQQHDAARHRAVDHVGTKNFTEQYVLGQLYEQALDAKGYKVVYKENIGSSELIDTALKSGKINLYPEYTGVIVADLAKVSTRRSRRRRRTGGEEVRAKRRGAHAAQGDAVLRLRLVRDAHVDREEARRQDDR